MFGWPRSIADHRQEIRRFGRRFWLRNLFFNVSSGLRPVRLGNCAPIYVRPGESDMEVIGQVWIDSNYSVNPAEVRRRVARRYEQILSEGKLPIIVDAGANVGVATIWFAREYPRAKVVAIEPDPGNFALLGKNVSPYAHCIPVQAAIGCNRGFAQLSNSGEGLAWTVQTARSEEGVPIITVDDAFAASGGDEPFIVKVDIEGFERDLFASNLEWLRRTFVLFVEPHDWMFPGERSSGAFQRAMADESFEVFISGDNLIYVRT